MFGSTSVLGWTIPEGWRFGKQAQCPDCGDRIVWLFGYGPTGEMTVTAFDAIGRPHLESCPSPARVVEQATDYAQHPNNLRFGSPSHAH